MNRGLRLLTTSLLSLSLFTQSVTACIIQWLGKTKQSDIIEKNFLGIRYDAGPEATAKAANEEYVVTLIKNDYQFADAYIVLGDILFNKGDYQLDLRAYLRVSSLPGEPS